MKKTFAIAAIALTAFAGAASAMGAVDLETANSIRTFVPGFDVNTLDASTANIASQVIHSGDSVGEKAAKLQAILASRG